LIGFKATIKYPNDNDAGTFNTNSKTYQAKLFNAAFYTSCRTLEAPDVQSRRKAGEDRRGEGKELET